MKRIKAALFGAGAMARMHARNALQSGGVELVGVCSRSSEPAAALQQELGVPLPFYPDFRTMIDTEKPDTLFVCVPPYVHQGEAEYAAEKGVHLFLEKPLALSLERADSICTAAAKTGIITQVDFHHRFHPVVQEMKAALEARTAGRPLLMQSRFFCNSLHADWWRNKELSGGQLLEQVIHLFDLVLYFLGPIRQLHAFRSNLCHRDIPDYTIEDTSTACLLAESGAMVSLAASNCAIPGRWEAAVHLICEKMTAFYSSVEPSYIVGTAGAAGAGSELPSGGFKIVNDKPEVEPHEAAVKEFLEAVRGKGRTSAPAEAAYRAQELVMRVMEAASLP